MTSGFRTDLFKGTAHYYEHFRSRYPDTLIADMLERVSGRDSLLDIACGTGQISVPLAKTFQQVLGLDQEPEMIELARNLHPHISWVSGAVESFDTNKKFDLITVGNAFHRLDRREVARRSFRWLKPSACLAILWSDVPWSGDSDWQRNLAEMVRQWELRFASGRVPKGWRDKLQNDPTETVLRREGLIYEGRYTFPIKKSWTVESIVGYANSTSTLSPTVLGNHVDKFASDIARLGSGPFVQQTTTTYELARKKS